MTMGDKIRYCRKHMGLTQKELAELTGIHPVSIRKYETNKMTPQPEQLRKLSKALSISYAGLLGVRDIGLDLETVGDLYGVIFSLIECNILHLNGDYENGLRISNDSHELSFNPLMDGYLEVETEDNQKIPLSKLKVKVKDEFFLDNLLFWDKYHSAIRYEILRNNGVITDEAKLLWVKMENFELDLQLRGMLLDMSNGIVIRRPQSAQNIK